MLTPYQKRKIREGNYHLIAIDETEHWILKPEQMDLIERIEKICVYNSLRHNYLCSMSPTYELQPIDTRVIFKNEFYKRLRNDSNLEFLREEIEDIIMYNSDIETEYHDVRSIDNLAKKFKKEDNPFEKRYKRIGKIMPKDVGERGLPNDELYSKAIEFIGETYRGNPL